MEGRTLYVLTALQILAVGVVFWVVIMWNTPVGAGCSCHPTGANHHLSPPVPLHPVWQTPVARLSGAIPQGGFRTIRICRPGTATAVLFVDLAGSGT